MSADHEWVDPRHPGVRFREIPADIDLGFHHCPATDDDRECDVVISYRRWGHWHGVRCCGLCDVFELVMLRHAPGTADVLVEERAEPERDTERNAA